MLILGILFLVIALVVLGFMYFGTNDLQPLDVDLGVFTAQLTPLQLYLLGAATLVVLCFGLLLLTTGLRRQRRRAKEVKELREQVHHREPASPGPRGRTAGPSDTRSDDRIAPVGGDREVPRAAGGSQPGPGPGPGPGAGPGAGPGSGPGPRPGTGPGHDPGAEGRPTRGPRPDGPRPDGSH